MNMTKQDTDPLEGERGDEDYDIEKNSVYCKTDVGSAHDGSAAGRAAGNVSRSSDAHWREYGRAAQSRIRHHTDSGMA